MTEQEKKWRSDYLSGQVVITESKEHIEFLKFDDSLRYPFTINNTIEGYEDVRSYIQYYRRPLWLMPKNDETEKGDTNVQESHNGDEQFWLHYENRYFPRTFCEVYSIFSNVFAGFGINRKSEYKICSVGAGSGGDIIGLLMSIDQAIDFDAKAILYVIEPNNCAYSLLLKHIGEANVHLKHIRIPEDAIVRNDMFLNDMQALSLPDGEGGMFDFILCAKMINEIMRNHFRDNLSESFDLTSQHQYYDFFTQAMPHLRNDGFCLVLDINDTPKDSKNTQRNGERVSHYANYLSDQTRRFLDDTDSLYVVASPWWCRYCNGNGNGNGNGRGEGKVKCYPQQSFKIFHGDNEDPIEKICFKVLKHRCTDDPQLRLSEHMSRVISIKDNPERGIPDVAHCPLDWRKSIFEDSFSVDAFLFLQ